ncbi:hypothetical protein GCM10010191_25150 [Actinomadura vinacea]|uniref:DUF397 domain-containing protein n=1 Tax=Actinomadura vinacea TaxID=115336 RepID=A0ABP5VZF6_9ACTN
MTTFQGPAPSWRKSTHSDKWEDCVELAASPRRGTGVLVRDSKDPGGGTCRFGGEEFAAFLRKVKRGELDL